MDEFDAQLRLRMIPYNARLIKARKLKGLTQIQLSILVNVSISTMGHIETLRVIPNPELMEEISSALEVPVNYIFPEKLLQTIRDGAFEQRVIELQDAQVITLSRAFRHALEKNIPLGLLAPEQITGGNLIDKEYLKSQIDETLHTLGPRERRVLELRFGLSGNPALNREEVGNEFSVTRERIRQIEAKALRKLRHPARSRKLKDYLE